MKKRLKNVELSHFCDRMKYSDIANIFINFQDEANKYCISKKRYVMIALT